MSITKEVEDRIERLHRETKESVKLAGRILTELSQLSIVTLWNDRADWDGRSDKDYSGAVFMVFSVSVIRGQLVCHCRNLSQDDGEMKEVKVGRYHAIRSWRQKIKGLRTRESKMMLKKASTD